MSTPLLSAQGVAVEYGSGARRITAVVGVDVHLEAGHMLALVGESGCGKSSLSRALTGVVKLARGEVAWDGVALPHTMHPRARKALARQVQLVFQNAGGALHPGRTLAASLEEALAVHSLHPGAARGHRLHALMDAVGLPAVALSRFPHQLSGGQRQRAGLARALAVEPRCLILDEPVSALDVSVQAGILNLLMDLRDQLGLAGLLISHDLSVVAQLCSQVMVMLGGHVVEQGNVANVFAQPHHPYTQMLLHSVPTLCSEPRPRVTLRETTPLALPVPGCPFAPRCSWAVAQCSAVVPALQSVAPGWLSACPVRPPPHRV